MCVDGSARRKHIQAKEQTPQILAALGPFSIKATELFALSMSRIFFSRLRASLSGKLEEPAGESQRILLLPFLPIP